MIELVEVQENCLVFYKKPRAGYLEVSLRDDRFLTRIKKRWNLTETQQIGDNDTGRFVLYVEPSISEELAEEIMAYYGI